MATWMASLVRAGRGARRWSPSASSPLFVAVLPAGAARRQAGSRGRSTGSRRQAPTRSAAACRVPRAGRDRAVVRPAVAADGTCSLRCWCVIAWRAIGGGDRLALLRRRVLRDCDAGGVVGNAPDARAARHRGRDLRGLRPRLARRAGRRAAAVAAADPGVGQRCGAHRRPACCCSSCRSGPIAPAALWALALLLAITQRRALRRERRRPAAARLAGRQPASRGS